MFPVVLLLVWPSAAQHAFYQFNTQKRNFNTMSSYLRWTQVEKGDVYLATHFLTGCSMGYFGGQFQASGSHMILFSMWDYGDKGNPGDRPIPNTARGVSPWCSRFGGEGNGAHCGLNYVFELGLEHRFELSKKINATGTLWTATVTRIDPIGTETTTLLGTIFLDQQGLPRDCSYLHPAASSFQEYFSHGNFYSAAAWRGPYFDGDNGLVPHDVDTDCGPYVLHSNVSSVVPNAPSGPPNVFFQMGGTTEHGCEKSMWRHTPYQTRPNPYTIPLVTRPTATRPTSYLQVSQTSIPPASRANFFRPTTRAPFPSMVYPAQNIQSQLSTMNPFFAITTTMAQFGTAMVPISTPQVHSDKAGITGTMLGFVSGWHLWEFIIATLMAAGAGIRVTMPPFLLSLYHLLLPEQYPLAPQGEWIGHWETCFLFGFLFLVEMVTDMIPALDHTLHVVLLPAHAVMGAIIAIAPDYPGDWTTRFPMAILGAFLAILVHSGKAILRAATSGATCGVLNPFVSSFESLFAVALLALSLVFPVVAIGASVLFILLGLYGIKAGKDKLWEYNNWGYSKQRSYDEESNYSNEDTFLPPTNYREAAQQNRTGRFFPE